MLHQQIGRHAAQIKALAARENGNRNLANFRGRKNELGVRRRLFQRLEQGVECLRREHVNFVENVDLVTRADRRVADRIVDLAHVVDAIMRSSIHLEDIDVPALHDRLAMDADHRHLDRRLGNGAVGKFIIESAGENARRGGLADPTHPRENPGLRNTARFECIRKRAHHRILADQIIKGRRPVFAREHAVGRVACRLIGRDEIGRGLIGAVAHNAIRSAARPSLRTSHEGKVGG